MVVNGEGKNITIKILDFAQVTTVSVVSSTSIFKRMGLYRKYVLSDHTVEQFPDKKLGMLF